MIDKIKAIIESMGIPFRYGNPSQINYYINNVDYAASPDGVAAYCYLLTDSEYVNGKERATIAVFFSKLIDFDFSGSDAVSVTDICKDKAKQFIHAVEVGNSLTCSDVRFQYGYNDFAENVAWCAVRAVFEVSEADCWPWKQLKALIPVIQEGASTTPEYDVDMKLLTFNIFTDSDVMDSPIVYIDNVATGQSYITSAILDERYFGDISQQYPEYWNHIFYTVFVLVEELPVTIYAKIGDVKTNSLLIQQ